jgi:Domain of Unknown Function (DUF748)
MWQRYPAGRWLGLGLLALLCGAALLQLLVPMVARPALSQALGERLGRQVCVESVYVNPWLLRAEVNGLSVLAAGAVAADCAVNASLATQRPQAALHLGHGLVRLDWLSLWTPGWQLAELHIDQLDVRVVQQTHGLLDVADLLDKLEQARRVSPEGASSRPAVVVRDAQLTRGSLSWHDGTTGQTQLISEVRASLPYGSTLPQDSQTELKPALSFRLNGALLHLQAKARPFRVPMAAEVSVQGAGLGLKPLQSVIERWSGLVVADGEASFEADLRYQAESEKGGSPVLAMSGKLEVSRVQLSWPDGVALGAAGRLELDKMALVLQSTDSVARAVKIQQVRLDRPVLIWPQAPQNQPVAASAANIKTIAINPNIEIARAINGQHKSTIKPWRVQIVDLVVDQPVWQAMTGGLDPAAHQANEWRVAGVVQAALSGEVLNASAWALTLKQLQWPHTRWQAWPNRPAPLASAAYLAFDALSVQDLHMDSERRTVALQGAALTGLSVALQRGRDGRLGLPRAADGVWWLTSSAQAPSDAAGAPGARGWQVQFKTANLGVRQLRWLDESPGKPVALLVSDLSLDMGPASWPVGPPVPVTLRAHVLPTGALDGRRLGESPRAAGQVSLVGQAQWNRPAFAGQWAVSGLALEPLAPYWMDGLNARLERGWLSAKGDVRAMLGAAGAVPQVQVRADVSLDDLALHQGGSGHGRVSGGTVPDEKMPLVLPDTAAAVNRGLDAGDPLVNWRQARLRGLRVALAPGQALTLEVGDTVLTDFFARIALNAQGQLNLMQLSRAPAMATTATADVDMPGVSTAMQRAQPAPAPPLSPTVRLGPVRLENGRVQFSDQFIQPNYAADISALTGVWAGIPSALSGSSAGSAPVMSQLALQGRIEGTGDLSIRGQLNPLVSPPLLDLQGQASDVELKPLTPYSIKYAGHGIEGGTLSATVAYRLDAAGQLAASHRLVLNQLRFGDAVDGAPANLPVRLAVALLADRHGVIDLEVPVAGSLKDPEFSVFPVVLKAVGNLIARAVTAPFALLGNALGGGLDAPTDDIRFIAGTDRLQDAARGSLASVGQALKDRPGAGVEVSTWVNSTAEREAAVAAMLTNVQGTGGGSSAAPLPPTTALGPSWGLDLARQRAVAVRRALEAQGASPSQIVLKPDVAAPQPALAVPAAPGAAVAGARLQLVAR